MLSPESKQYREDPVDKIRRRAHAAELRTFAKQIQVTL